MLLVYYSFCRLCCPLSGQQRRQNGDPHSREAIADAIASSLGREIEIVKAPCAGPYRRVVCG